jgi:hypothetical protein
MSHDPADLLRTEPSFIDRLVQRLLRKPAGEPVAPAMEARMMSLHQERGTRAPLEMRRNRNRRRNRAARQARRANR